MNENSNTPFGITRAEVLELAAAKVANEFGNFEDIHKLASNCIKSRVELEFKQRFSGEIEKTIQGELDKIMSSVITPVDIWGEPTGKATTLKAALAERAGRFWSEPVDAEGRSSGSYGAKPRAEWMFRKIASDEFANAMKQDIINQVGAFKDAVAESCQKAIQEHINTLIKVRTSRNP